MKIKEFAFKNLDLKDYLFTEKWIENMKNEIQSKPFNSLLCEKIIWATSILTKNKNISLILDKETKEIVDILVNKESNTLMHHTVEILNYNNECALFILEQQIKTNLENKRIDNNE